MILTVRPSGGRTHMFAIAFSAMVILALVSIVVHWTMRIRLMRLDSTRDRIEWLSFHGGDDVLNTYEALLSRSVLPRFCRYWTVRHSHSEGISTVTVEISPLHSLAGATTETLFSRYRFAIATRLD